MKETLRILPRNILAGIELLVNITLTDLEDNWYCESNLHILNMLSLNPINVALLLVGDLKIKYKQPYYYRINFILSIILLKSKRKMCIRCILQYCKYLTIWFYHLLILVVISNVRQQQKNILKKKKEYVVQWGIMVVNLKNGSSNSYSLLCGKKLRLMKVLSPMKHAISPLKIK